MVAAVKEFREKLADYLTGKIALDAFEDWFVQNSWNAKDADPEERRWIHGVELCLSEFSSHHLSENQLRKELRPYVTHYLGQISLDGVLQAKMDSDIKWSQVVLQIGEGVDTSPLASVKK
jgi:hypothetical protein